MENPIRFDSDEDRLRSGHEKNKTVAWVEGHLDNIIHVHDKIKKRRALTLHDLELLDIVLNNTVCSIFHDQAEQEFLVGRHG